MKTVCTFKKQKKNISKLNGVDFHKIMDWNHTLKFTPET